MMPGQRSQRRPDSQGQLYQRYDAAPNFGGTAVTFANRALPKGHFVRLPQSRVSTAPSGASRGGNSRGSGRNGSKAKLSNSPVVTPSHAKSLHVPDVFGDMESAARAKAIALDNAANELLQSAQILQDDAEHNDLNDVFDRVQRTCADRQPLSPPDGMTNRPLSREELDADRPRTPWRLIRPKSRCAAACGTRTPMARRQAGELNFALDELLRMSRLSTSVPPPDAMGEMYDRSVSQLDSPKHRAYDMVLVELLGQANVKLVRLKEHLLRYHQDQLLPARLEAETTRLSSDALIEEVYRLRSELEATKQELEATDRERKLLVAAKSLPDPVVNIRRERDMALQQLQRFRQERDDLIEQVRTETQQSIEHEAEEAIQSYQDQIAEMRKDARAARVESDLSDQQYKKKVKGLEESIERLKKKQELELDKFQRGMATMADLIITYSRLHETAVETAYDIADKSTALGLRVLKDQMEEGETMTRDQVQQFNAPSTAIQRARFAEALEKLRRKLESGACDSTGAAAGGVVTEVETSCRDLYEPLKLAFGTLGTQVNQQLIKYHRLVNVERKSMEVQTMLIGDDIDEIMGTSTEKPVAKKKAATGAKYKHRSAYIFIDEIVKARISSGDKLSGELKLIKESLRENAETVAALIREHLLASKNGTVYNIPWCHRQISHIIFERIELGSQVRHLMPIDFCYDFSLRAYGLPSMAKQNLGTFVKNISRMRKEDPFIAFFHEFLWALPLELFNFFVDAWALCADYGGQTPDVTTPENIVFPEDENGGPNWLELPRATEVLYQLFSHIPMDRAEMFCKKIFRKRTRGSTPLFLEQKRHVCATLSDVWRVNRLDFLQLVIEEKMFEEREQHRFFCMLFVEGDDNGDGVLEFQEFQEVALRVNPQLSIAEVTIMFREACAHPFNEGADEDALQPEAFSVVARQHELHQFVGRTSDWALAAPWTLFDLYASSAAGANAINVEGFMQLMTAHRFTVTTEQIEHALKCIMTIEEDFLRMNYIEFTKWWGDKNRFSEPYFSDLERDMPTVEQMEDQESSDTGEGGDGEGGDGEGGAEG